jgi:hypothetical protein
MRENGRKGERENGEVQVKPAMMSGRKAVHTFTRFTVHTNKETIIINN